MKKLYYLALSASSLLLLTQCATQEEVRELSYQLRAVNQKVEHVKDAASDQLQKGQAFSSNKVDSITEQVQQLRTLVEESTGENASFRNESKESLSAMQAAIDQMRQEQETKLRELEARVEQLAAGFNEAQQARLRAAEERAREAARRAEEAKRKAAQAAAAPAPSRNSFVRLTPDKTKKTVDQAPVVTAAPSEQVEKPRQEPVKTVTAAPEPEEVAVAAPETSSSDPLKGAKAQYNNGDFKGAYKSFEQILSSNPGSDTAAETLYYMGETRYKMGEYDLAILDYQKVISNHSSHGRKPAALLKQGMAFEKLTDNETAKIIYKKLINEHPGSAEAKTAEKQLANL